MTAKIRIMGTIEECRIMADALDSTFLRVTPYRFSVRSVSKFYPNRGPSIEGRVYVEVDINAL